MVLFLNFFPFIFVAPQSFIFFLNHINVYHAQKSNVFSLKLRPEKSRGNMFVSEHHIEQLYGSVVAQLYDTGSNMRVDRHVL